MNFLKSRFSWLAAPLIWLIGVSILFLAWAVASPEWIRTNFDNHGVSPVESATIGLFFFQMAFFWLVPPMRPGRWRAFWLADFSLLTLIAICRELDWHKLMISVSDLPGATTGTPFKLRFLTNPGNPLGDRLIVAACFIVVTLVCAGTLLYFLRRLLTGLFKLHPVCWSVGFLGGTAILIQVTDRIPSVLRKRFDIHMTDGMAALMTALEEGQELLLPLFVLIAVLQAHFIYNNDAADSAALEPFKNL